MKRRIGKENWHWLLLGILLLSAQSICLSYGALLLSQAVEALQEHAFLLAKQRLAEFAAVKLLEIVLFYLENLSEEYVKFRIRLGIRGDIVKGTLRYRLRDYLRRTKEPFVNAQVSDMDIFAEDFLNNLFNCMYAVFVMGYGCIMLWRVYPVLGMAMLAAIIAAGILSRCFGTATERCAARYQEEARQHATKVRDIMNGFYDIYFGRLRSFFSPRMYQNSLRYETASERYYVSFKKIKTVTSLPMFAVDMLLLCTIVAGMIQGKVSVGALTVYISLGGLILNSSENLFGGVPYLKSGLSAIPKELWKTSGDGKTAAENAAAECTEAAENAEAKAEKAETAVFELKEAGFRYGEEGEFLFQNQNLVIREHEKCILQGKNGSGKSTLLKLLAGLEEPTEGTVLFYGEAVKNLPEGALYERIGYLSQEGHIFRGTLAENIFLGEPATEQELQRVLEAACLTDFEARRGADFLVEKGGENISGGEAQRIRIARMLTKKKEIYLLDEPIAEIDPETAAQIEAYFLGNPAWTVVMISHDQERLYGREGLRFLSVSRNG